MSSAAKVRLFAAVELPDRVLAAVSTAVEPLRRAYPGLRWTDPESGHLTLTFLGWVPDDRVAAVREALAGAATAAAPFELALTWAAGSFRGGVLWAELEPQPALARVAERVERCLTGVVPLPDVGRPFRPHLTVARARGRSAETRRAAEAYDGPAASWTVDRFVLMRSHPSTTGARYEVVGAWPLIGAGA